MWICVYRCVENTKYVHVHACKYIPLMIIIQVEGEQHEHHEIIQKLHQNLRDTFVSEPTWRGKVALMCADDLEKMPLNQLAYNKKRLVVQGKERTAPTYNFDSSRKLTFTTFLVLEVHGPHEVQILHRSPASRRLHQADPTRSPHNRLRP